MFVYKTQLRLRDTDATGVLYFAEQFRFALEAFEEFLQARGFPWKRLMDSPFLLPVVHAQADYLAPLEVGDLLEVTLQVGAVGTSSVRLLYTFHDPSRQIDVGRAEIVHVSVDRQTRKSIPLPDALRAILCSVELCGINGCVNSKIEVCAKTLNVGDG